jgi:hypothetical protein
VKPLVLLSLLFLAFASAQAQGKKLLIFALLTKDTPVELADGGKWMMDKGDAFPVVMFKEQHTKLVLQLAGTNFIVPAENARVLEEKEVTEDLLVVYRRNVANYLDSKSRKWQAAAQGAPEN